MFYQALSYLGKKVADLFLATLKKVLDKSKRRLLRVWGMFPSYGEQFDKFFGCFELKAGSFNDCKCPEFLNCTCFMTHKAGRILFINAWEKERSRLQAEYEDEWLMGMEMSNASRAHFRVAPGAVPGCVCRTKDCACYRVKGPELYKELKDSWEKTVRPALLQGQNQFRELKRCSAL